MTYKELAELYKRSDNKSAFFQTLELGIKKLNSIEMASVYVDRALTLNQNERKALKNSKYIGSSRIKFRRKRKTQSTKISTGLLKFYEGLKLRYFQLGLKPLSLDQI